jgi:phosphatidylserine/phosphatidylglycerophosphate/cardiolipin synthase-like enzyme
MERIIVALVLAFAAPAYAQSVSLPVVDRIAAVLQANIDRAPAVGQIETGFSPEGSAERLILKVINSSRKSIRLAAYSFTSPKVVHALVQARRRGIDVRVVADARSSESKPGAAALNLLVNADIQVRTNARYAILHDKFIVADGAHVQTGSFNYSRAAAERNSENVLVIWNNPELAASYLAHWESRYGPGMSYRAPY